MATPELTRAKRTPVGEFFMELLHAATIAHILHLQTKSVAIHLALDEVYKGLPGLVDELIESYQGKNGIVSEYSGAFSVPADAVSFIDKMMHCINRDRKVVGADTELQNIVDEIADLFNTASYKVRFLS